MRKDMKGQKSLLSFVLSEILSSVDRLWWCKA